MLDPRVAVAALVILIFAVAAFIVRLLRSGLRRSIDALDTISAENRAAVHRRAARLVNALAVLAYGIAAAISMSLALTRLDTNGRWDPGRIGRGVVVRGINVAVIIIIGFVGVRAAHLAIEQLQYRLGMRAAISSGSGERRHSAESWAAW